MLLDPLSRFYAFNVSGLTNGCGQKCFSYNKVNFAYQIYHPRPHYPLKLSFDFA